MSREKTKTFRTTIGGQALIEGVMMRGPAKTVMAVRKDGGILSREEPNKLLKEKYPPVGWPFVRGVVGFAASMAVGLRALTWSAEQFPEGDGKAGGKDDGKGDKPPKSGKGDALLTGGVMILSLLLAVGLFTVLPTFLGGLLSPAETGARLWRNLIETGIRLVILLGYMLLVSRVKDIQRTFAYHGAEHKAIACYEAGAGLTVENARRHSRFHPRCGTSFLLTVVMVSLLVFLWVTWENALIRVALRLSLLPVVVAVSYEINRLVGRYDNRLTRALRAPGLWMQRITTREPDDSMLEVALAALEGVIPAQKGADDWDT